MGEGAILNFLILILTSYTTVAHDLMALGKGKVVESFNSKMFGNTHPFHLKTPQVHINTLAASRILKVLVS